MHLPCAHRTVTFAFTTMNTLRGITWKNPRGYDPLVAASALWRQRHPSVEVLWEQLPWYQFEERVLASLASGESEGAFDLIMFDHPWTGKLASERWLVPWDELAGRDYIVNLKGRVASPSTESYEWAGHLWALPLDAACHAGLIRTDLVQLVSIPATWEAMQDWAAERFDPPTRYPLVLSVEGVLGSCLFLSMMAGMGHAPYLEEENPTCDKDAAGHVLRLVKSLLRYTPPGSSKWGPWDIYEHLCNQDNVGYSPSIFAYANYFKGKRGGNLRLRRVPGFSGGKQGCPILGGVGLGIARTCKNLALASEYGKLLMSDEVQRDVFPFHSGQPAARAAWANPLVDGSVNGFYSQLADNMRTAYVRPRYKSFHRLELNIGAALQRYWDDVADFDATLSAIYAI